MTGIRRRTNLLWGLVVLAVGMIPREDTLEMSRILNVSRSGDGFFLEAHPKLRPIDTFTDGIFLAGSCQGPKDIPDSLAQASGAAAKALSLFRQAEVLRKSENLMGHTSSRT